MILKRIIRRIASDWFHVDIVSNRSFGYDILRDIATIANPSDVRVVLDVGANLGETTMEFASIFKSAVVYSFEPDPTTFNKLNARAKPLQPRVRCFNVGLGCTVESRDLIINMGSGGNSFLEISPAIHDFAKGDWTVPVGKVRTELNTLDNFCEHNGIDNIDLIKIDTQGYELEILNGGKGMISPDKTKLIYIEVLFVELYKNQVFFSEIYSELTNRGYRLVGLYNRFYKPDAPCHLLWCDALFASDTTQSRE